MTDDEVELGVAVELFNKGSYLAAHEVLDDLWEATAGPEEDFYKGLIQASIALHQLGEGKLEGAERLHRGQRKLLARYLPTHRGWDLARFLVAMRARIEGGDAAPSIERAAGEGGEESDRS